VFVGVRVGGSVAVGVSVGVDVGVREGVAVKMGAVRLGAIVARNAWGGVVGAHAVIRKKRLVSKMYAESRQLII
jgi:hypothetical protein